MIVLDTHALVWWTREPLLLSGGAAKAINHAERILVPAICFRETFVLVRKGRLALEHGQPVAAWVAEVLTIPSIHTAPLSVEPALAPDALTMHAGPADRLVLPTTLAEACALATKDALLRRIAWL